MSGHSKWATIKRRKGAQDAKRAKIFTKLIREITVAAKAGGGDPVGNARLRLALQTARASNMPADTVQRAVDRGTGGGADSHFDEVTYEGYGPSGVALMIDTLTDNRNRTAGEVRHALTKHNGNLGESGCVAWIFDKKGVIFVSKDKTTEDRLMEVAIEAGADDVIDDGDGFEIMTGLTRFEPVRKALDAAGIAYQSAQLQRIPGNLVKVGGDEARRVLRLMEALEDLDDVQHVSANFDIPDDVFQEG